MVTANFLWLTFLCRVCIYVYIYFENICFCVLIRVDDCMKLFTVEEPELGLIPFFSLITYCFFETIHFTLFLVGLFIVSLLISFCFKIPAEY